MKTSNWKTDSQKLAGTVQTARLRVATAENRWQAAKQQARVAKRRRKEVKLIARRARKQAKEAKADLADARKALAKAEAKLAKSGARRAIRKPAKAKARPVAKVVVAPTTKKAVQVTPASLRESASPPVPAQTGPATFASTTTEPPKSNPKKNKP